MNPVRNSKKHFLLFCENSQFNNIKLKISNGVKIKIISGILGFIILLGLWSFFVETKNIKIENISIQINNLPSSFQGVKIVHLSDFHSTGFEGREKKVLEALQRLNPDFVFITGDFIDWRTKNLESCQNFWQELSRNYQKRIFGVLGNHDHHHPKFKTLKNLLKESGIEVLENEAKKIKRDEEFVYLIGVDDPHGNHDNIEKAMAGIENDAIKILLAHSPEIFRKTKRKNINLILVGHTHGGQINIPFITDLFLPLKYDKQYKSGFFQENLTYFYVNRGIGTTLLPFRFNSPPEITLITLK